MKRALIITSAGSSTRFRHSVGKDVLKVIYYEGTPKECLLSYQLELISDEWFDIILIVGGYAFAELRDFITQYEGNSPRLMTVYNDKFQKYGTCYSFACGLNALRSFEVDEIVFIEGDLMFDDASFSAIVNADSDVITANRNLIRGDSVVFYTTITGEFRYAYNKNHHGLCIDETFTMIGNSGQVWKFRDAGLLHRIVNNFGAGLHDDTNLQPFERYFNSRGLDQVTFITFKDWFNCNTIDDYRAIRKYKDSSYE